MRFLTYICLFLLYCRPSFSQSASDDSTEVNKVKLYTFLGTGAAFTAVGIKSIHYIWYKDKERVPFHFYKDAKGYLQIDKFGHAYGAYMESYIGYHWLRSAGVSRTNSLLFGGGLGFLLQAPIEVFDGMYEGWGFSWSDMVANAAGAGVVIGNELLFREQLVKYKFSFSPSPYREQAHGYLGDNVLESLFLDYNAHTYWLSLPANRLFSTDKLPNWLNLAAGYSANGMFGEFENKKSYRGQPIPETERYRQFLLSPDIDWTRIPTRSRFLQAVFKGMFFIKLPFPALEINSMGKIKAHAVYF